MLRYASMYCRMLLQRKEKARETSEICCEANQNYLFVIIVFNFVSLFLCRFMDCISNEPYSKTDILKERPLNCI